MDPILPNDNDVPPGRPDLQDEPLLALPATSAAVPTTAPTAEAPQFSGSDRLLFAVGGRFVMAVVLFIMLGSLAAMGWAVWAFAHWVRQS